MEQGTDAAVSSDCHKDISKDNFTIHPTQLPILSILLRICLSSHHKAWGVQGKYARGNENYTLPPLERWGDRPDSLIFEV
jgi:hypothetical protein